MTTSIPDYLACPTCGTNLSWYGETTGGGTTTRFFLCSKCDKVSTIESETEWAPERHIPNCGDWILARYWTDALTQAILKYRSQWKLYVPLSVCRTIVKRILGEEAMQDLVFEFECAQAHAAVYGTKPPSFRWYDALLDAFDHVRASGRLPFGVPEPPFDANQYFVPRVQADPREIIPQTARITEAEDQVKCCAHDDIGEWLYLEGFLGRAKSVSYVSLGQARQCNSCKAVILCSCIADDFRSHFQRCPGHSVGFKPLLCDLCDPSNPIVGDDLSFRGIYPFLQAVRLCRREMPALYEDLFDEGKERALECDRVLEQIARADAFTRIVGGSTARLLRRELRSKQPNSKKDDHELAQRFRPFFDRARSMFRVAHGLPGINEGWVSETTLLHIVRALFPGQAVLDHYRPSWLQGMELDIFLPDRALAFEYMGLQHYQPVEFFGGKGALDRVVERDRRKREICAKRGIHVIDIRYDEPLTHAAIKAKCNRQDT